MAHQRLAKLCYNPYHRPISCHIHDQPGPLPLRNQSLVTVTVSCLGQRSSSTNPHNCIAVLTYRTNNICDGLQVRYLEVVDTMVGQLLRRLWEIEQNGTAKFCTCVTGDHSTPVVFGDHSHEPVPFAIAHLRSVARVLLQKARSLRHTNQCKCVVHQRCLPAALKSVKRNLNLYSLPVLISIVYKAFQRGKDTCQCP